MSTGPAPAAPEGGLSEPARLMNVFLAPGKTFCDLKRKASWWAPWLIVSVAGLALSFTVAGKVGFRQVTENEIRLNPRAVQRLDQLAPAQREQQLAISASVTKGASYAYPLVSLIVTAIIAAVFMATLNFGAGAAIPFPVALAVVFYASLALLAKVALAAATLLGGANPEGFLLSNPVGTNPAYFMNPAEMPGWLYSLLSNLDAVNLWWLALMAIGFAWVSKVKRTTCFAVVFGWWALAVLVRAGLAAMAG